MLPVSPVLGWTIAAVATAALGRLLVREWRRVNEHLHPGAPVTDSPTPDKIPTLRRDPQSGIYRPE